MCPTGLLGVVSQFCGPHQHGTASGRPDTLLSETVKGTKEKEASLVTSGTASHFNLPRTREAKAIIILMFAYNGGVVAQRGQGIGTKLHN